MPNKVVTQASWWRKFLFKGFRQVVKPLYGTGIGVKFPFTRKVFWALYRIFNPGVILTEIEGIKLYLDPKSSFTCGLMMIGHYEKGVTKRFRGLLKEGMVVLDAGANVGYYSLIAARLVGKKGKVLSFEPAPDNFAYLENNIKINGFVNIIPVQKAVSDKTGKGSLFLWNDPVSHGMYEHHGKGSIEIDITSIDNYMANMNLPVDLIKMDVEGSEMKALEGMRETIRRNPNLKIITEFAPDNLQKSGCSPEAFLEQLITYGFKLSIIDEETEKTTLANTVNIMKISREKALHIVNLYCDRQV